MTLEEETRSLCLTRQRKQYKQDRIKNSILLEAGIDNAKEKRSAGVKFMMKRARVNF